MTLLNALFVVYCLAICTVSKNIISTVYKFPDGISLENLVIGPYLNTILVTSDNTPSLYHIHLPTSSCTDATAEPIYTFPNATGLLGITKYAPRTFAVIIGNFSIADFGQNTGFSIWSLKFVNDGFFHESQPAVEVHKITDVPQARMLNGMTTLDEISGTVLIGDSLAGCVYYLCTRTGRLEVVLEDDETMKPGGSPGEPVSLRSVALNGIRKVTTMNNKHGSNTYLYYSNSNKATINRVLIDPLTGRARGPFTTLTTSSSGFSPDDLAYDYGLGAVYYAGHMENVIVKISLDRGQETVVVNETAPSSLIFGVGEKSRVLYVTTSSRMINGTKAAGGKLMAIQLDVP